MKKSIYLTRFGMSVLALSLAMTPTFAMSARAEQATQHKAEAKERIAAKLDEIKQKVCQKRQASIKKTADKMHSRGDVQFRVFSKIAERTQQFYKDKGRTIATYDSLVQAVNDRKADAQKAISEAAASVGSFSCTADNAATFKDEFKASLQKEIAALKAYRTAVKDLIVAVKSAQGQTSRDQANASLDNTPATQGAQ